MTYRSGQDLPIPQQHAMADHRESGSSARKAPMETNSPNGRQSEAARGRSPATGLPESQERDGGRGAPQAPDTTQSSGTASRQRALNPRRAAGEPSLWSASPFDAMMRLSREMDQLMGSFFGTGGRRDSEFPSLWSPQVEVRQSGDNLIVSAELPGVAKDAIQIEATDEGIAISGERRESREEGGKDRGYHLAERSYGSFYRNIPLPDGAQVEEAKASMRDGVLEITMPLRAAQARKRIEISS
jgi:HSP20 family protein